MEELENVPSGHGDNFPLAPSLESICPNPEAKRAFNSDIPLTSIGNLTSTVASFLEPTGLLEENSCSFTIE